MTRGSQFVLELSECRVTSLVGGKAASLGRLSREGFPVPDGFVVTTHAYEHARATSPAANVPVELGANVAEEVRAAYGRLGMPTVAVRSSATAEDMAGASMAGQYETFLNVQGEQALLDAVRRCWASLDSARVRTYLREHGIDPSGVAMAVVVQRLVSADVAGVLFTANPHQSRRREMLIEASWGLGEMVVSGKVQPDVLRVGFDTGRILEATIADKQVYLAPGATDSCPVEECRRRQPCLSEGDADRLWRLGRHIAEHFGRPMDIEWAIGDGELYLLQSRPITTLQDAEARGEVLRTMQQHLRRELAAGRGPWVLHNLAETMPHPTPLTWSVIQRFMSGAGGFGLMYRQAGFEPSPTVQRDGFLERIAGRVYMDAARAPELFFENFPFTYDIEELRRSPDASQAPPTRSRGSCLSRWRARRKLDAVRAKLDALSVTFESELRENLFREITVYVANVKAVDLGSLSVDRLVGLWQECETKVLDGFGPCVLMPGLIAAMAMGELQAFLQETLWDEDADALSQSISAGGAPDRTLIADEELYEVAAGSRPLEKWLADHGHRAVGEFDLAAPRWREQPYVVRQMADRLAAGTRPMERHGHNVNRIDLKVTSLRPKLTAAQCRQFDQRVSLVRQYIVLREDSKDFLMLGYDFLRDLALEAGRRLDIGQDVFYLTRDELFDALRAGFASQDLIEQRKAAYRAETRLALPHMIDATTIDALGEIADVKPIAGGHKAFAVSSGESTGPARILHSPAEAGDLGRGYVLVCPSTDPSWTPLFVNAAGLVLECGGTLSHGAVVAREMGLPAVVLPDATRLFREGEQIRVDGHRGWVGPVADRTSESSPADVPNANDVSIPRELIPPPVGSKDRRAGRLGGRIAVVWAVYIAAFSVLPQQWVHGPTLSALDAVLWPVVRSLGKPAVVAVVAAGIAILTLLTQKVTTDNRRLLEAKRRAAALKKQAGSLPVGSARRTALMHPIAQVQGRTLIAAMVPVGILLGPLVLSFVWFHERVDPAAWNAPAGSAVQIVARVDSDWDRPVRIEVPQPVVVDDSTPHSRTLPPLRATLEHLLALYRQPRDDPNEPWELKVAPDPGREQTISDLQAYLDAGIPPRGVTWLVRPPDGMTGRFPVSIVTEGHAPLTAYVVLGNEYPPALSRATGPVDSPVRELRIVYPRSNQKPVFWQPLASLAGHDQIPLATRLAAVDAGWLWLYILTYLPALVLARFMLKVA
jgi:rifampicin phosphotransferase